MTKPELPLFACDRDGTASLKGRAPHVLSAMQEWKLGKVDEKETIHFCGLVHVPEAGPTIFLPREARTDDPRTNLQTASSTMMALARFGAEVSNRELEGDGETGNPGTLAVVKRLADDFRDHGVFSERKRRRTRNSGKPDWLATIKREVAMTGKQGRPVFADLRTSRASSSSEALLAQIQCAVLREILEAHGWWLIGSTSRRHELSRIERPSFPRGVWPKKLDAMLPSLYTAREIFLAQYLGHYLRDTRASAQGSFVFGVSDFHSVWETILRETIIRSPLDNRRDWNSALPKPTYTIRGTSEVEARSRGMQADIIFKDDSGYTIADAKYYSAKSAAGAPGLPDISKQMFYEKALTELLASEGGASEPVRSVFVFPSKTGTGPLASAEMRHTAGQPCSGAFPIIECAYVCIRSALECYVKGIKAIAV